MATRRAKSLNDLVNQWQRTQKLRKELAARNIGNKKMQQQLVNRGLRAKKALTNYTNNIKNTGVFKSDRGTGMVDRAYAYRRKYVNYTNAAKTSATS